MNIVRKLNTDDFGLIKTILEHYADEIREKKRYWSLRMNGQVFAYIRYKGNSIKVDKRKVNLIRAITALIDEPNVIINSDENHRFAAWKEV